MIIPSDSALCPVCALRGALETQGDSVSDISSEIRFEHYRVLENAQGQPLELGRGGMGMTYKAIDVNLQCAVALKVISAGLIGPCWDPLRKDPRFDQLLADLAPRD